MLSLPPLHKTALHKGRFHAPQFWNLRTFAQVKTPLSIANAGLIILTENAGKMAGKLNKTLHKNE